MALNNKKYKGGDYLEKTWTVYMHISPSGKRYIGITGSSVEERWKNGLGYKTQLFYRAIEKYGWDNFQHIIIAENLSLSDAEKMEIELIKEYNTITPNGYNRAFGGLGSSGHTMSDYSRQKLSQKLKGRAVTAETLDKRKETIRNRPQEKTKKIYRIIGDKMLGDKHPSAKKVDRYSLENEYIDTFSSIHEIERLFGFSFKNISACCRGLQYSAYGYKWCYKGETPESHIHNGSISIDRFSMNGEYIDTFQSITSAAKKLILSNACRAHISDCCNGKRKSSAGFIWRYHGG